MQLAGESLEGGRDRREPEDYSPAILILLCQCSVPKNPALAHGCQITDTVLRVFDLVSREAWRNPRAIRASSETGSDSICEIR